MGGNTIFEWQGKNFGPEVRSSDWYWALGIIAVAGVVAGILFSNIILSLVIAAAAVTLALQAMKRPRIHRFAVTDLGLTIDDNLYSYDSMLHFSILEYIDPATPPALSIKTNHLLAPHLLIPITGPDPDDVYEYISQHLEEGNHHQSVMDRFIEIVGL